MRARCWRDSRHTASSSLNTSLQMPQLLVAGGCLHGCMSEATKQAAGWNLPAAPWWADTLAACTPRL